MILSIIIPVYNVERYIDGTLHSIYSQGVDEQTFEVIVVNDGTPDNSMAIVERYARNHENLSTIHQTNQGLSCARNAGLSIAKGDYLWFVDSDDQLAEGAIAQVMGSIEKFPVDIVGFDMVKVSEDSGKEMIEKIILFPKFYYMYNKPLTCYDILHKAHSGPVQRFIFRHDFLKENNLKFLPNIIHEDIEFMAKAYFLAKDIVYVEESPYRYLLRSSGSIMSSLNMKSVYSKRTILDSLCEFSKKHCNNFKQRAYLNARQLGMVFSILDYRHETPEYVSYIKAQTPMLRRIAWKGVVANIYVGAMPKIIKGMMVMASPLWYRKMMTKYVKKQH